MRFTCSMLRMAVLAAAFLPPATSQIPLFGNLHGMLPADADRGQAVAVGDVDGDGDPDMVIGNGGGFIQGSGGQNRLILNVPESPRPTRATDHESFFIRREENAYDPTSMAG